MTWWTPQLNALLGGLVLAGGIFVMWDQAGLVWTLLVAVAATAFPLARAEHRDRMGLDNIGAWYRKHDLADCDHGTHPGGRDSADGRTDGNDSECCAVRPFHLGVLGDVCPWSVQTAAGTARATGSGAAGTTGHTKRQEETLPELTRLRPSRPDRRQYHNGGHHGVIPAPRPHAFARLSPSLPPETRI